MNIIVLSNLQTDIVSVTNYILRYILLLLGVVYIADAWNSTGVAVLTLLAYIATEGFLTYLATDDVVYIPVIKKEEEGPAEEDEE